MWLTGLFFMALYAGKYLAVRLPRRSLTRVASYILLFLGGLAYVYLVLEDWAAPDLEPEAHWIGAPLLYLTIPTITFFFDIVRRSPRPITYVLRSIIEICLFPIWMYVVAFIMDQMGWVYF